jgi:rhamnogalacturonan endolyase
MRLLALVATALIFVQGTHAAFGLTSTSTRFKVDTDAGLVFEVNRSRGAVKISYSASLIPNTGRMEISRASNTMASSTKAPPK